MCKVQGCDRPVAVKLRQLCDRHYQAWSKEHFPRPECSVAGCSGRATTRGWCSAHYARWYKTGSTEPAPRPPRPTECIECRYPVHVGNLCRAHYQRKMGYTKSTKPPRGRGLHYSYWAIRRVLREPENAINTKKCIRCGTQAAAWVLDVTKRQTCPTTGRWYSPNPDDYMPMCRPHRAAYGRENTC